MICRCKLLIVNNDIEECDNDYCDANFNDNIEDYDGNHDTGDNKGTRIKLVLGALVTAQSGNRQCDNKKCDWPERWIQKAAWPCT